ncbi:hypothetical protein F4604DRAFT_1835897 [Suillus subluteus]|nr:hypothetical protein F4604DRAFT_1835897 [Suillus subluteus]
MYLDELQHELHSCRGVFVSVQTLLRTFRRLHLNRKHISAYALERNEEKTCYFLAPENCQDELLDFGRFHFLGFCFAIAFSSSLGVCIQVNNECSLEFRHLWGIRWG